MANPNWLKGGKSPNPDGRRKMKHSSRTVKGMVQRFILKNITPNKLQTLYDGLSAKDKLHFLTELLPYCAAKQATQIDMTFEKLSDRDLDLLYQKTIEGIVQVLPGQTDKPVTKLLLPEFANNENFKC